MPVEPEIFLDQYLQINNHVSSMVRHCVNRGGYGMKICLLVLFPMSPPLHPIDHCGLLYAWQI